SRALEVLQEAVGGAHGQVAGLGDLRHAHAAGRNRDALQGPEVPLQRRIVVQLGDSIRCARGGHPPAHFPCTTHILPLDDPARARPCRPRGSPWIVEDAPGTPPEVLDSGTRLSTIFEY